MYRKSESYCNASGCKMSQPNKALTFKCRTWCGVRCDAISGNNIQLNNYKRTLINDIIEQRYVGYTRQLLEQKAADNDN